MKILWIDVENCAVCEKKISLIAWLIIHLTKQPMLDIAFSFCMPVFSPSGWFRARNSGIHPEIAKAGDYVVW